LASLYCGTISAARADSKMSSWFETLVGVLQGCVLAPLLFIVMLEVVRAMGDVEDAGILVSGGRINNFQFADDIAILAGGQNGLQPKSVNFIHLAPDLV